MNNEKMIHIGFRIHESFANGLQKAADKKKIGLSTLLRQLVIDYLVTHHERKAK